DDDRGRRGVGAAARDRSEPVVVGGVRAGAARLGVALAEPAARARQALTRLPFRRSPPPGCLLRTLRPRGAILTRACGDQPRTRSTCPLTVRRSTLPVKRSTSLPSRKKMQVGTLMMPRLAAVSCAASMSIL